MSFRVSSVQEYFDTLDKRFNADGAKGVNATFQFELSGDEGGNYHVSVEGDNMSVNTGDHDAPDTTIKMTGENYVKMVNGDLNGQMAYMSGKLKIKGSIPLAMKMKNIFPQVG